MSEEITTNVGGATVTVNPQPDTPSAEIKATAVQQVVVNDAQGRAIKLQRPSIVAEFQFVDGLGDTAKNEMFYQMAAPLLFVVAIDGMPVVKPKGKAELYELINRLGEDGMVAMSKGIVENFGGPQTIDDAKNE